MWSTRINEEDDDECLEASLFGLWSSLSTNLITNSAAAFTDQEARQAIATSKIRSR